MKRTIFGEVLYGLVLTGDNLTAFLEKAGEILGIDQETGDVPEFVSEKVFPNDKYTHYEYFDGEENEVDVIHYINGKIFEPEHGEPVLVLTADHEPKFFKPAYKNAEELVSEFKNRYEEFMPDSFDYKANIGQIIGTVYCG